jgi:DNA/RNA endonuclease G (NUC1)
MKKLLLLLFVFVSFVSCAQDTIRVKKAIFEVLYSQKLEQPLWLKYRSTNRPTLVNRGSMDFYPEPGVKTSDGADYYANPWDKGHLAPAATFSDTQDNLKQTFTYLNCMLQQQDLNRGEWRLLEEQERKWDDIEPLTVIVKTIFNPGVKLPTGATIPTQLEKHIYFEKSKKWRCFKFKNEKPNMSWVKNEMSCPSH